MNNKQFQIILRKELKNIKRFSENAKPEYSISCRHWNLDKAHLNALYNMITTYTFLTDEEVNGLIKQNPVKLRFLNECMELVPNMLQSLRESGHGIVFEQYYDAKKEAENSKSI